MKIDEINQALKATILGLIVVPIGYLLSLLFPQVKTFLNDHLLPSIEKATLSIWLCIFAYLLSLSLVYIFLLYKKINKTPSVEMLQFLKWEEIEKQYEEQEISPGYFFHVKKAPTEPDKTPKYACPTCYQNKIESTLNCESNTPELGLFSCPVCDKRIEWNNYDYSKHKK